MFGIKGFRRDFVETEGGTIAFFRIMPNNLTVLPEAVIEYQIEQMKQLLQNEDDLSVFCTDGSEIGEENVRFFKKRIAEEKRTEIKAILQADMESFEARHRQRTSLKQFFILLTMDSSWTDEMLYTRAAEIGKKLHEHGFANSILEQSGIRHLLGIYFSGSMYAEQWKEEDFYEYVTRDRVKEERKKEPEKEKEENELDKPYRGEWNYPPVPTAAKQKLAEKALSEVEQRVRGELTKKEQKRVWKSEKKEKKRKETIRKEAEAKKEIDRKKREKERRKEEYEFSLFWKRVMPGVVSFRLDEAIVGDTFRHYMAIREYQPSTTSQAILKDIAGLQGVSLKIFYKRITMLEEEKLITRGSRSTVYESNRAESLSAVVDAGENLSDVSEMFRTIRKERERILYCSVFLEIKASTRVELENIKADVRASLMADKIMADELTLQQKEGMQTVNPLGRNHFGLDYCRPLPAGSVANLYPFSYSGRLDPHGIRIGRAENGTDVYLDPDRRTFDVTNGNIVILGSPGQGKSFLTKFLSVNVIEQGKRLFLLDPEEEYESVVKNIGGTYIDFLSGRYHINILEPKRWTMEEDPKNAEKEMTKDAPESFNQVGKPLSMHISFLKDFFRIYKHFSRKELDVLEVLFLCFYESKDINDANADRLPREAFPTMCEFYKYVYEIFDRLRNTGQKAYEIGDDPVENGLFRVEEMQSILIGICSMSQGPDSVFFNGVTNLPQDGIVAFGVKGLMESNADVKDAVLFHLLSYISDQLLVQKNAVGVLDEFYLFLTSPVVVEYVRNMMKRNRKRDSFRILTSQNVEDFLLPGIKEYTKPLLSIPSHRFLFYPGNVEANEYMDLLQLEDCEFEVIRTASKGRCLFQCGNERYKLLVQAPEYKEALFGTEGGR
ncbi:MAG: hypothetical protein IJL03_06715 [Lachnospiraceae bacterium]|nr:hypothetical protein [Lachnospiraceae bacterium]